MKIFNYASPLSIFYNWEAVKKFEQIKKIIFEIVLMEKRSFKVCENHVG